jgi:GTP-binding protein
MTVLQSLYSSAQFYDEEDDVRHEVNENVDTDVSAEAEGVGAGADKLPKPKKVKVQSADFIKSSVRVDDCPPAVYPEFAVIGRSNVGKSSLINMLTGRNSLAMVSKTPGKTKCINHFLINKSWYLVDLPGYGYARTSKANVMGWNKFTREYFGERETLVTVLLLVDASIPPMELDLACACWFAESEIPYSIVYTKLDKKKKGCPPSDENIAEFERRLSEKWDSSMLPPTIRTSSKNGKGKAELLNHIAQLRALWNEE